MKSAKLSRLLLLFALVLGTAALVRGAAVPSEDDAELIEPDPFDESGFDEG